MRSILAFVGFSLVEKGSKALYLYESLKKMCAERGGGGGGGGGGAAYIREATVTIDGHRI